LHAETHFTLYRAFARLIRHPLFFVLSYLLIGGLMVQNELLDTPGSLPAFTKVQCTVSHPCSVWSRPFLVDPF
jgi:membrane protein DedA with SNARE-associated domain